MIKNMAKYQSSTRKFLNISVLQENFLTENRNTETEKGIISSKCLIKTI